MTDKPSGRRQDADDLGLPAESDPSVFEQAFVAVRRCRGALTTGPGSHSAFDETDDLGLPLEGDPGDFACAFLALRGQSRLAPRRSGETVR